MPSAMHSFISRLFCRFHQRRFPGTNRWFQFNCRNHHHHTILGVQSENSRSILRCDDTEERDGSGGQIGLSELQSTKFGQQNGKFLIFFCLYFCFCIRIWQWMRLSHCPDLCWAGMAAINSIVNNVHSRIKATQWAFLHMRYPMWWPATSILHAMTIACCDKAIITCWGVEFYARWPALSLWVRERAHRYGVICEWRCFWRALTTDEEFPHPHALSLLLLH